MTETAIAKSPAPEISEPHPLALLEKAISSGMDPDKLGKLMDLAERWKAGQSKEAFNRAMALCQQEMPVVVRDAENNFTKKKYERLETMIDAIKPVYTKHGFSVSFNSAKSDVPGHIKIIGYLRHQAGHVEEYEGDFPLDNEGAKGGANKSAVQATGSTFSYGRRYLTRLMFNVAVADEDNDGNPGASPLDGEQIRQVNELIEEIRSQGKTLDFDRFMKWIGAMKECQGATSLDQVPLVVFPRIIKWLNDQRRAKAPARPANGGRA